MRKLIVCDVFMKASDTGRRWTKSERSRRDVHWDQCKVELQRQTGLSDRSCISCVCSI